MPEIVLPCAPTMVIPGSLWAPTTRLPEISLPRASNTQIPLSPGVVTRLFRMWTDPRLNTIPSLSAPLTVQSSTTAVWKKGLGE